jgi:hypothetical protein
MPADARFTPIQGRAQFTVVTGAAHAMTDVLSTRDLVDGSILAFALAFLFSALQQRRSRQDDTSTRWTDETKDGTGTVFDADEWKEMSRPENYVYYNSKLRESPKKDPAKQEKTWVVIGLLVLFVPIFSAEFFLSLSRQFICDQSPFTQSAWASELCSPHF